MPTDGRCLWCGCVAFKGHACPDGINAVMAAWGHEGPPPPPARDILIRQAIIEAARDLMPATVALWGAGQALRCLSGWGEPHFSGPRFTASIRAHFRKIEASHAS